MTTNISIIGSGFGMYGLLPAFGQIHDCDVVSICGKDSERMRKFCTKYDTALYSNWKEMIEKEKPDAVGIAVVPDHQYEIARFALENDIGVFAEKPLTISVSESDLLTKLAKKKAYPI